MSCHDALQSLQEVTSATLGSYMESCCGSVAAVVGERVGYATMGSIRHLWMVQMGEDRAMSDDQELRRQLERMLTVRQAHMDFEEAVADFPEEHVNTRPPNLPYTFWHLLEHMRICQRDILDYIVADDYVWPDWPDDLWPDRAAETDPAGWQRTVDHFLADRKKLVDIIRDPNVDLFAPLPNSGEYEHNVLREINVVASHNAYHTSELAILRGVMDLWADD